MWPYAPTEVVAYSRSRSGASQTRSNTNLQAEGRDHRLLDQPLQLERGENILMFTDTNKAVVSRWFTDANLCPPSREVIDA